MDPDAGWFVPESEVEVCKGADGQTEQLGKGGFGVVLMARYQGNDAVLKLLVTPMADLSAHEKQNVEQELAVLRSLQHPNIVQYLGACIYQGQLGLILELMEGGSLQQAIWHKALPWGQHAIQVLISVARGLEHLHDRGLVHRDLKSRTVLLGRDWAQAKISYAGFHRISTDSERSYTFGSASPEQLVGRDVSSATDIFSLGVLLWELTSGNTPHRRQYRKLRVPQEALQAVQDLISQCMDKLPSARPNAFQVLQRLQLLAKDPATFGTERPEPNERAKALATGDGQQLSHPPGEAQLYASQGRKGREDEPDQADPGFVADYLRKLRLGEHEQTSSPDAGQPIQDESGTLFNMQCSKPQQLAEAKRLAKQLLQGWRNLSGQEIQVDIISGGITNLLWKLSPGSFSKLDPVLLRVFGQDTDKLIDRSAEASNLRHLNDNNFGAKVLGSFENGRFEGWLSMRTLKPQQMCEPAMARRIACRLRHFHAAQVPGSREPQTFTVIKRWLAAAEKLDFHGTDKQAAFEALDFPGMAREVEATEQACLSLDPQVVFTHNDLLSGNILVAGERPEDLPDRPGPDQMQFIDFEYAWWGFRGFDIANHFCEYAGFECDYSRYPDQDQAALFMRHYLSEDSGHEPDERSIQKAVVEANAFALAAHQFWGVWAILQAKYSPIDFDYVEYWALRWGEYHKRKDAFLAAVDDFLASSKS